MRSRNLALRIVFSSLAIAAGCGQSEFGADSDGLWILSSLELDGETLTLDEPLFLEIEGTSVGGDTTCNQFQGQFGGDFSATAMGCLDYDGAGFDRNETEQEMIDAILSGAEVDNERLVFDNVRVRMTYERFVDPSPGDLYAILGDESRLASADEIYLDLEAGGRESYDRLVRLEHTGTEAVFFIGVQGELVCLVASTDAASFSTCQQPRYAGLQAVAIELTSRTGPTGIRSALIPDQYVAALENRPNLGSLNGNILLVDEAAPTGRHKFEGPAGQLFVLVI
jgi:hypothetical protein